MRIKPKEIIREFKKVNQITQTARNLGIHRTTVYRWIKRGRSFNGYLKENVYRKSTRPHRIHLKLGNQERIDIERIREKYGYAAVKIKGMLGLDCSPMTIQRFLKIKGFVKTLKNYRRPKFQNTVHMHAKNATTIGYLQMDVKYITPELSGLPWTCFEYAVIDIFSRYKEAVISNQLDQDGAMVALLEILPKLPFKPVFIQTDNGLEFQQRFTDLCKELKLKHHHIHKRTPNENAVIERSFRTDEEEFFFRQDKKPKHYDELRERFAEFIHFYNHERLHLGINLMTPYQVVANVVLH
jgi:transposase InsO family protein